MIIGGIIILPVLILATTAYQVANLSGAINSTKKRNESEKGLEAEIILPKSINLDKDEEIKIALSTLQSMKNLDFLKINCCVVIDVNNVFPNKYIKVVKLDKAPPPVKVTTPEKK